MWYESSCAAASVWGPICESCPAYSFRLALIWQHCCFVSCRLVWTSQDTYVILCCCTRKSTVLLISPQCKVSALPLLFGCLKPGKLARYFSQPQVIGIPPSMDTDRNSVWGGGNGQRQVFQRSEVVLISLIQERPFCLQFQQYCSCQHFREWATVISLYPPVILHCDSRLPYSSKNICLCFFLLLLSLQLCSFCPRAAEWM